MLYPILEVFTAVKLELASQPTSYHDWQLCFKKSFSGLVRLLLIVRWYRLQSLPQMVLYVGYTRDIERLGYGIFSMERYNLWVDADLESYIVDGLSMVEKVVGATGY